jgi:hypothetical protein
MRVKTVTLGPGSEGPVIDEQNPDYDEPEGGRKTDVLAVLYSSLRPPRYFLFSGDEPERLAT